MYARYLTFKSGPEHREAIEAVAEDMYVFVKMLKGFLSITYVISEDQSTYGSFSVWASREDAESAGQVLGEKLAGALGDRATTPPEVTLMEVYQPLS